MLLTHGREPLRAGVVREVGEVFGKERCGLEEGLAVVQVQRVIWGQGRGSSVCAITSTPTPGTGSFSHGCLGGEQALEASVPTLKT